MKLLWILFHFQTVHILCGNTGEDLENVRAEVKSTFSFDVKYPLNSDSIELFIWKITENQQKLVPQKFHSIDGKVPPFQSSETYVVLSLVPDYGQGYENCMIQVPLDRFIVYYWVGNNTTLACKQTVAKYAIKLYSLIVQYYDYRPVPYDSPIASMNREVENMESESFKRMIDSAGSKVPISGSLWLYYHYLDTQFPTPRPNLHVVKGDENGYCIKRIPLDRKWLKNNVCLVMETGLEVEDLPSVTVYCGSETPLHLQERSKEFSADFKHYYECYKNGEIAFLLNNSKTDTKFKSFIEVFENRNYEQVDNSDDYTKDAESFIFSYGEILLILKVTSTTIGNSNENTMETKTRVERIPIEINSILRVWYDEIYLFDSKCPAGVFLIIGQTNLIDKRMKGIQYAEYYLHENYTVFSKPTRMRILDSNEGRMLEFL